ncbi:uncharacterized protein SAMN06295945_0515 [Polynucleobacter meluiroseus]|uniref:Large ribosomal RNA subunit accumulation protein YceD n=1 Tax=Polynucleobacter meluiroseus TaxID=1938814 RepID=A0A240DYU8_9BURK|nr:YceD family protein [Polynucleobacter meluiroseus]SNX28193.1 uncharacterized protein SAMN06295945_0515 [Polynucleobacter meluiroseus]
MNRNQVLTQVELSADPVMLGKVDFCAPHPYKGRGFLALSALPRVAAEASTISQEDGFHWTVATHFEAAPGGEPIQILQLGLEGRIELVCQRCLKDFAFNLKANSEFVLLKNEAEADAYPIEDDHREPLVASQQFDLLGTIEDEILLSLPLIPKHPDANCAPLSTSFGEDDPAAEALEKPQNPFKALKDKLKVE